MVEVRAEGGGFVSLINPATGPLPLSNTGGKADDDLAEALRQFKETALKPAVVRAVDGVLRSHGLSSMNDLAALPEAQRKAIMSEIRQTVQRVTGALGNRDDTFTKFA
jgi:hypothetical protein